MNWTNQRIRLNIQEIDRSSVIILPEITEQEMHEADTNTRFDKIPTNRAPYAVDKIIVIDDNLTDDDYVIAQECKLEHDNVMDGDVEDTDQTDDVTGSDMADTQEEVNPTQSEDNALECGSSCWAIS